jgi:pimeloyl-ACP methyl ester carboxylesterase
MFRTRVTARGFGRRTPDRPEPAAHRLGPAALAAEFGGDSGWRDVGGPLHVVDFGGSTKGCTFVLIHGLGGSFLDWTSLAPRLTSLGRVLAIDLPAFGYTPVAGRLASVDDDAALVQRFIEEHVTGPVILAGNSRGGMVAALAATALPAKVTGVVLLGPALPTPGIRPDLQALVELFPAALPFVGPHFVRLARRHASPEAHARRLVRYCFPAPDRVPAGYVEAVSKMLSERPADPQRDRETARAARTVVQRFMRFSVYDRALDAVRQPVLHLHGARDRLVPVAAARRALQRRSHWHGEILSDVGHTPQLEVPDHVAASIGVWLGAAERSA